MTIEQDVKNWLADEGVFREKAADENADFHFVIEFPKDNVMDVVKPKEKDLKYKLQINFTQATKICLNFFRYKGKEPPYDIEATIQRFLLPIRPNRKRQRVSVSTCVVSFNYRLA